MNHYLELLSILILLSSFILVAAKRIISYIWIFRLQSLLLVIMAGYLGAVNFRKEGDIDILIICMVILVVKVIYIPRLLENTFAKVAYKVEKDFFLNIPISILICCGLVILSYFSIFPIEDLREGVMETYLVNSISVILTGLFFMISRKKAIGQIIGFLVIENGLFIAALLSAHSMPILVDLGIFVDVLAGVMIMGILVFRINENFESININKLRNLRG